MPMSKNTHFHCSADPTWSHLLHLRLSQEAGIGPALEERRCSGAYWRWQGWSVQSHLHSRKLPLIISLRDFQEFLGPPPALLLTFRTKSPCEVWLHCSAGVVTMLCFLTFFTFSLRRGQGYLRGWALNLFKMKIPWPQTVSFCRETMGQRALRTQYQGQLVIWFSSEGPSDICFYVYMNTWAPLPRCPGSSESLPNSLTCLSAHPLASYFFSPHLLFTLASSCICQSRTTHCM